MSRNGGLGMKKKKKTFYATPQASKKSLRETREIVRAQKYDADRISLAIEEAERTSKPVAILVGTEFGS